MNPFIPIAKALFILSVLLANANAATVHYVNPVPQESRVYVGFDNDSSGYQTTDLDSDGSAFARNDTAYGPLPPAGQLPSFDAKTYAATEFGTNLYSPTGTGVRSAFSPLNFGFAQAHGESLQATGAFSSNAYAYSGNASSPSPAPWIIHVMPEPGETLGAPTQVTINADIDGTLNVAGFGLADALWNVTTTTHGGVMTGSALQPATGGAPFSDTGTLVFTIPLGSSFELLAEWDLSIAGGGPGANVTSEIDFFIVEISAVVLPPIINPITVVPANPVIVSGPGTPGPYTGWMNLSRSYSISNPDQRPYEVDIRVFSNERFRVLFDGPNGLWAPARQYRRGDGRFYIAIVTIDDGDSVESFAHIAGLAPRRRGSNSIERLMPLAQSALEEIRAALLTSTVDQLSPTDFGLHENRRTIERRSARRYR